MTSWKRRLPVTAVLVCGVLFVTGGVAAAFWQISASGDARANADTLAQAATPTSVTTTPNANSNTVRATVTDGFTIGGRRPNFQALRFATDGAATPTGSPLVCGAPSGSPSVVECDESSVPDGEWFYTARQVAGSLWQGPLSTSRTSVLVDTKAPVVTAAPVGWVNTDVTAPVSAADVNPSANNGKVSGVSTLSWTGTNGLAGGSRTNTTAQEPFAPTGPTVTAEGTTTISYTATDGKGNAGAGTQAVKIDKTAPVVTISGTSPAASGTSTTPTFSGTKGVLAESTSNSTDGAGVLINILNGSIVVVSNAPATVSGSDWTYTPPSGAFTAGNTYTVTATQSDLAGNATTVSRTYQVMATMTASIGTPVTASLTGGKWTASMTITVIDNAGAPVEGAVVSGTWSYAVGNSPNNRGTSNTPSCTTGSQGTCPVTSTNESNVTSATFTIDSVTKNGLTYTAPSPKTSATAVKPPG